VKHVALEACFQGWEGPLRLGLPHTALQGPQRPSAGRGGGSETQTCVSSAVAQPACRPRVASDRRDVCWGHVGRLPTPADLGPPRVGPSRVEVGGSDRAGSDRGAACLFRTTCWSLGAAWPDAPGPVPRPRGPAPNPHFPAAAGRPAELIMWSRFPAVAADNVEIWGPMPAYTAANFRRFPRSLPLPRASWRRVRWIVQRCAVVDTAVCEL
jgi:hypothetical protein